MKHDFQPRIYAGRMKQVKQQNSSIAILSSSTLSCIYTCSTGADSGTSSEMVTAPKSLAPQSKLWAIVRSAQA